MAFNSRVMYGYARMVLIDIFAFFSLSSFELRLFISSIRHIPFCIFNLIAQKKIPGSFARQMTWCLRRGACVVVGSSFYSLFCLPRHGWQSFL